jgi:hypothetical protein
VPQPFRKGAAFGKFVRLSLEVNYVDRLPVEDGAACDAPTRAREPSADFLRNRTPVSGRTNVLPVELKNGDVVGPAKARRTLDDNVKHRPELGRRSADDSQNLSHRRLLLERLGKFLFQIGAGFADAANARSRFRCLRTKTSNAGSALRPFARQDHLIGTVTGPLPVGPAKDRAYQS